MSISSRHLFRFIHQFRLIFLSNLYFYHLIVSFRLIPVCSRQLTVQSSVDPNEVDRFRRLSSSWWNETGEYAALHSLNQLRVPFIREQLLQSSSSSTSKNTSKPLKGLQLLDIGCGGGILTEVCRLTK